jgi:hypothetical protein
MALDGTNFEQPQFGKILESLGTLADESFDLSPDVVRVGLVVYRFAGRANGHSGIVSN